MPFSLHPSGFCSYYSTYNKRNLIAGSACPECKRIAGHAITCSSFKFDQAKGHTSRPKLFNATSILWARDQEKNFITFTLPSLQGGTYQRDIDCPETGDLVLAAKFSKVLEAWAVRVKRSTGKKLSYVWAAEAQMKRKNKFGGVGDIHFHLVANQRIKNDSNYVTDRDTLTWLQARWCSHIGAAASNCVHIDPLPDRIESIPGYLTKQMSRYMTKGTQRAILGRQFAATRDLTRFKPINLTAPPVADLINSKEICTSTGYETTVHYFNTREILELYGAEMLDEAKFHVTRTSKAFSSESINRRALKRLYRGLSYST